MKKILLDSSVIIKWFKSEKENKVEEAEQYLVDFLDDKIKIFVSQLTLLEIINSALYDKFVPFEAWKKNIEFFFGLNIQIIPLDEDSFFELFIIGHKYQITSYDASYIALAKELQIDFVTADIKLAAKVKLPFVKLL